MHFLQDLFTGKMLNVLIKSNFPSSEKKFWNSMDSERNCLKIKYVLKVIWLISTSIFDSSIFSLPEKTSLMFDLFNRILLKKSDVRWWNIDLKVIILFVSIWTGFIIEILLYNCLINSFNV